MEDIRIAGLLSREEARSARRLAWMPHYWINLANNYIWRRFFNFMALVFCFVVVTVLLADHLHTQSSWMFVPGTALSFGSLLLLLRRHHELPLSMLGKINAASPTTILLGEEGVYLDFSDGMRSIIPWHLFKGWRSGDIVALLDRGGDGNVLPIPLQALGCEDRGKVRTFIARHLGDATLSLLD